MVSRGAFLAGLLLLQAASSGVLSQADTNLLSCSACKKLQSKTHFHTCSMCPKTHSRSSSQQQVSQTIYDCVQLPTNGEMVVTGSGETECSTMYCLKETSNARSGECSCHPCLFKKAVQSSLSLNLSVAYANNLKSNSSSLATFEQAFRQSIAKELGTAASNVEIQDIVIAGADMMPSNHADGNKDGYITVSEYSAWREANTGKILTVVEVDYKNFMHASGGAGRISKADFDKFVQQQFAAAFKNQEFTETITDVTKSAVNVTGPVKVVAGSDLFLGVAAKDVDGNPSTDGMDSFFMTAFGAGELIFINMKHMGNGQYVGKFTPTVAGKYSLRVDLRTSQTEFSKVDSVALKVLAGPFDAVHTTLEGGVFSPGTVSVMNTVSHFDVVPHDKYGNLIKSGDQHEIDVAFLGTTGKSRMANKNHARIGAYGDSSRVRFKETMATPYDVEVSIDGQKLDPTRVIASAKKDSTTRHMSRSHNAPAAAPATSAASMSGPCAMMFALVIAIAL